MPCGSKSQPRSDGDNHAFAFASGDGSHLHQSQEHRAAALVVAIDGDRDRAGGDRAARIPGHGQWIPANHRRLRRRRHCHRAAGRLAGGNQQHRSPRSGAPDRGWARYRARRKGIAITAGRMFNRGSNEVVVGKALLREFEGFDLGSTVSFGATRWTVVGVFDAGGSVFESEIWADLNVVQSLFNRNNFVQTVRARLTGPAALNELKSYSDNDPRLKLDVKSEAAYFAEQASQTSDLIQKLGWPLAIAMALGALAGALNTMYSSVAARATEIATLRAIGFGGLLGAAATYLIFDGITASTLGGNFTQVVFDFKLSPWLIGEGVVLALIVGLIGGLFPALRAARLPIVAGLNPT